ncbi:MAG: hypothetical protein PHH01_02365 [Patescibacteria group bacterium]|nr:hypothetical protein [Patescibacteria group bacterium]
MKYGTLTLGQIEALCNKLGGPTAVERLLQEGFALEFTGEMAARLGVRSVPLFDRHGRCIPGQSLKFMVVDPNRAFRFDRPVLDYSIRLARIRQYLECYGTISLSAEEFQSVSTILIEQLRSNARCANALNGVYLPIVIPAMVVTDYGDTLNRVINGGVGLSYAAQYHLPFANRCSDELAGKVSVVDGTRHDHLIARLARGAAVALFFPNPLRGFSIKACQEQIASLSEGWLLAGGIDTAVAFTAYPDVLGRDHRTPGLDCAALRWESVDYSLRFDADDDHTDFNRANNLNIADASCGGGLLFVGNAS